jgi:hypothetical protein
MSLWKKVFTTLIIAILILAVHPFNSSVQAAPPADPYADAANALPGISVIITPDNALGAPDSELAVIIGVAASLQLDLGEGEEGTGDLTVYYGGVSVSLLSGIVTFLDENESPITTGSFNLVKVEVGTNTVVIPFDYADNDYTAYRYVIFTGLVDAYGIDAIETASYLPDSDGDTMPDDWEVDHGLDPLDNADGSTDPDDDGLTNAEEYDNGTDPSDADTDNDTMPDGWEVDNGLDPLDDSDATGDPDSDGLTNAEEYLNDTDPNDADTDDGGVPDGWEVDNGLDPLDGSDDTADTDDDGLTNVEEYENGTDPNDPDTDNDGMPDGWEVDNGLDPLDDSDATEDPDGDGFTNEEEYENGTDPNSPDYFLYVPIFLK